VIGQWFDDSFRHRDDYLAKAMPSRQSEGSVETLPPIGVVVVPPTNFPHRVPKRVGFATFAMIADWPLATHQTSAFR